MTGRSSWNRRISNLCGTMCIVALPSLTMVSFPGFFSMIAGSSLRDFNGLVQYFSKMSPSTHLRVDRASDSWSTLLQNSDGPAVSPHDRSTGATGNGHTSRQRTESPLAGGRWAGARAARVAAHYGRTTLADLAASAAAWRAGSAAAQESSFAGAWPPAANGHGLCLASPLKTASVSRPSSTKNRLGAGQRVKRMERRTEGLVVPNAFLSE